MIQRLNTVTMHRHGIVLAAALALAIFTACGGGDSNDDVAAPTAAVDPTATTESAAGREDPVGVIAIGHSGMNAQNSNPEMRGYGAPQNSWSTGTSPEFESVYERLVAIQPEHEGHVFNAAEGGTASDALVEQAELALSKVPAPALVMIMTIDNDIRCDGTDDEARITKFGENVANALHVITEASPRSRILIVSVLGRPPQAAQALLEADDVIKAELTGTGMCVFYTPAGEIDNAEIANLTSIIEMYEAEQTRICEQVPQCSTDGGLLATYQEDVSHVIPADGHLNVAGQAATAKLIWPTVEALMTGE